MRRHIIYYKKHPDKERNYSTVLKIVITPNNIAPNYRTKMWLSLIY